MVLPDGPQQRHGLYRISRRDGLDDPTGIDIVLHRRHHQPHPGRGDQLVSGSDNFVEVVTGVDVHDRERQSPGPKRLQRQVQHDDGVLAPREQQHWPLELGGHLPDDVDGFGLQQAQMAQLVLAGCGAHRHIAGHGFLFHVLIPDKSGRIDHIYGYCHLCNQASLSLSTQPHLGGLPVRQCALG